eukprot:PITA_26957
MLGWIFHALDVSGRSGGIAVGFKQCSINLKNIWGGGGFLGADIYSRDLEEEMRIINVYGPCQNRELYWRKLLSTPFLLEDNVILGGDLNFSLGFSESWGHQAQIDPLSDFFEHLLEIHHWIDIPSAKIQHTWRNNRTGDQSLARRLDRFIIKEAFHNSHPRSRQWVSSGGISDHRPIYLEVGNRRRKNTAAFKFNSTWLRDPSYIKLISDYWKSHPISRVEDPATWFVQNLSEIKKAAYESLTKQRTQVLKDREASWRLRSRAIWLQEGDENTKFFHRFANGRKAINTIWELQNDQGQQVHTLGEIAALATSHFKNTYEAPREATLLEIMRVVENFPRFVDVEDEGELTKEVTMGELEATIWGLQRDKSPGPDGWPIEFYTAFFDLLGQDLLSVINHCRLSGKIPSAIKSTFIALIPKSDKPISYNDFRPISLCNCLYKIMAKILANRLKSILSAHISLEQFSFLQNRQIHEAIGSAQELLHSMQSKKLKGMILKVDLSKAFDKASLLYIRMLLTHLGFPYMFIKWIMSCITDVAYNILLNGSPTPFFTAERGLRQG